MMPYWNVFQSKNQRTGHNMRQSLAKRVELLREALTDIIDVGDLCDGRKWYSEIARDALYRDSDRLKLDESLEQQWKHADAI